jgi:LysM repeat protein
MGKVKGPPSYEDLYGSAEAVREPQEESLPTYRNESNRAFEQDEKDKKRPPVIHHVHPTDTLVGISLRYGVSVDAIRQQNRLASNEVFERRELIIPYPTRDVKPTQPDPQEGIPENLSLTTSVIIFIFSVCAQTKSVSTVDQVHRN